LDVEANMSINLKITTHFVCIFLLHVSNGASFAIPQDETQASGQSEFQWLDSHRGSADWARVHLAFRQELEPDVPNNINGGVVAYKYKYIYRVGVFKTAALVVIGHRITEGDKSGDYFSAFNYDMRTGSKSAIEDADVLSEWKFVKLAQFQPSVTPDVAFRYVSCTECEEQTYVASFQYDPAKSRWDLRKWGRDKHLLVGETPEPDDEVVSSDCLHKISDWNADGFDDVAVWCKEVSQDGKGGTKIDSSTIIYSFKDGHFTSRTLTGSEEITVHAELCRESTGSNLCKHHKN
jgi:hypothetical protein